MMKILQKIQLISTLLIFSSLIISCAKQQYIAKPLDTHAVSAKILSKNLSDPAFKQYLSKQGYQADELPVQLWGLNELTYAALYFNPQLDVAKAQLALANTAITTANLRINPAINGTTARSDRANDDINPWAFGLDLAVPIETKNKRQIRVEEATQLRDVAQMTVAETGWLLRSQIAKDLIAYHENIALQQALSRELETHTSIINMLEKRFDLGLLASTPLSDAKLLRQKTEITANTLSTQLNAIRATLAADIGISVEQLNAISIKPLEIDSVLQQESALLNTPEQLKTLQQNALLNRLDIRRSLAKYAAAEARIKLEVAKQTPDIVLTPGYIFEFGDRIWSLGFSSLLNLLNKNQTLIAEATRLREIEGAQFEALQSSIIGNLNLAYAHYQSSLQQISQTQSQLALETQHQQTLQKQLESGLVDRLFVTQNALLLLLTEQQLIRLKFNSLKAAIAIEDVMQRPILDHAMPHQQNQWAELNP
jgi:cobalt-zinc-cadmium efflux system outer membrane protein